MIALPAKGTTVFYCDGDAQWPFVVCELHISAQSQTVSGWAFESGKTSYYRNVPVSIEPREGHWQYALRDERFGQTVDKG